MSGSIEMGMAETHDGFVKVLVAGAIAVNIRVVFSILFIGNGIGVGAELHETERDASARKSMAHLLGADEWIHIPGKGAGF